MTDVAVLVVGAGPTGLLLAAELKRRNVDVLLIDAHDAPLAWDRATVVHPRSIELFDALGISEPLLAAGVPQRLARIHSHGALLGDIDLSLSGSRYPFNLGLSEEVTERILNDHLEALGGSVTRATRLVDLAEDADGVTATLESGGVQRQVRARWVVGCDGFRSTVRTLAGIGQEGEAIEEPWAVFDATIPDWPHTHEANFAFLDEPPVILTSLPDRRWRAYLRPSAQDSDLVADVLATLAPYLPGIRFADVTNPTRFRCHSKVAQAYRAGRLLLAGDAAHTCSPVQGHGMNSGLQDAWNLGWKLALVANGLCADSLLDSYEAERRPVAQKIVASGSEADSAMLMNEAGRLARNAAIRDAFSDPATRHQEAVAEAELDIDYGASPIVVPGGILLPTAGQALPAPLEIRPADGMRAVLRGLYHRPGHTVLLVGSTTVAVADLTTLQQALSAQMDGTLFEASFALTAHGPGAHGHAGIDPSTADRLGIGGITLFVVRPDGYLGLRTEDDHAAALLAYAARLGAGAPAAAAVELSAGTAA
ncbi:oxygenase [Azorhizobium oxalatiphilum]|uniref:Oxygenase n=1 Tax=Azorhizobium oxalatiphilum TaxID=980631 RepID=A0A917CAP1_9HYPH|nr:FAD-dependent monooxygenase [Azorhizobium oxalatiphilum]GGF75799.1 oxygenase [Azorhizobium oxalatiphilum]